MSGRTMALKDARIARGMAAQIAHRRERLAAGATPIGWKVGFGAPAAMAKLQLEAPLVGHLLSSGVVRSDASVSLAGWIKPVAEPEICIEMATDLPGGASEDAVAAAIASAGPAIELADLAFPPDDVERILAENIFHRRVILGRREPVGRGGRIVDAVGVAALNGSVHAKTTALEENTGPILGIVRHVADLLAELGIGLRRGEIIICGSVVPPLFLTDGDQSVGFDLEPIGSVGVRLQW